MQLFHGSTVVVGKPKFGTGNPHNDYGLGFYCTENLDLAKEWACRMPANGFANQYSIVSEGLSVLDLTESKWHILNWLAILLENRIFEISSPLAQEAREYMISTFLPSYKDKDIIVGYRADDSYFSFAKAFLNGTISLRSLSEAMRLGKLGQQYCIKSQKGFDSLTFEQAIPANGQEFFIRRSARDLRAREDYIKLLSAQSRAADDIYMIDILRQQWGNDDERLR